MVRVKIPRDPRDDDKPEDQRRNKGLAFVQFAVASEAQRALEAREISIDFASLTIEQSMRRSGPPPRAGGRDGHRGGGDQGGFELLRSNRKN